MDTSSIQGFWGGLRASIVQEVQYLYLELWNQHMKMVHSLNCYPVYTGSAIEGVEVESCCSDATDIAGVEVEVCWTMHFCD